MKKQKGTDDLCLVFAFLEVEQHFARDIVHSSIMLVASYIIRNERAIPISLFIVLIFTSEILAPRSCKPYSKALSSFVVV
jgi:hypothetical protein